MPVVTKQKNVQKPTGKQSVIDRIAPIGFSEDDGIKMVLYGQSKTGKTTLWATFPKPILAIISSGLKKPGEARSINTPEYRKTIKQVVLQESTEVAQLVNYHAGGAGYKTVVLDHATGLQDLILKEILGLDELPTQKAWGLATQQQYGQCSLQTKEILRALLGLDCNVVIVAQEREFNTEGNVSDILMPFVGAALTPSVTGWLNPAVDYIVQTFKRQKMVETKTKVGDKEVTTRSKGVGVDYCLRVGPDAVYTTGFRVPKGTPLPDVIVNADFPKLYKLIQGG